MRIGPHQFVGVDVIASDIGLELEATASPADERPADAGELRAGSHIRFSCPQGDALQLEGVAGEGSFHGLDAGAKRESWQDGPAAGEIQLSLDVPLLHVFAEAFSQVDPDVGAGEIVLPEGSEAAETLRAVSRGKLPGNVFAGAQTHFGTLQGKQVFSGTEKQASVVGRKGEPGRGSLGRGGRDPEGFAVVHQAQPQSFFVPQVKMLDFEQPHQGRQVLAAAEDIGRVLHQEPHAAAPDIHTADTQVQGVGIGLQGQYAGVFLQVPVYAVGPGGEAGIQLGKSGQDAVGGHLHIQVPGDEVAADVAFSHPPGRELGKPGAAVELRVKLPRGLQVRFRDKGAGD